MVIFTYIYHKNQPNMGKHIISYMDPMGYGYPYIDTVFSRSEVPWLDRIFFCPSTFKPQPVDIMEGFPVMKILSPAFFFREVFIFVSLGWNLNMMYIYIYL